MNFHPPPPPFSEPPFLHRPQTPQPGFGSITLLQKFTPHFKILDPYLYLCLYLYFTVGNKLQRLRRNGTLCVGCQNWVFLDRGDFLSREIILITFKAVPTLGPDGPNKGERP